MFSLIARGYEAVWRGTAKVLGYPARPFTYIMRQWGRQNPGRRKFLTYVVVVGGILAVYWWAGLVAAYAALGAFWIGALWGHLYWDTRGTHIKHGEDFDV